MLHPDEARNTILSKTHRLSAESVHLGDAFGRVLAADVVSSENLPPFPASTMDGFAVIADDPSPWREVVGHQTAGYVEDLELHLGTAAWITTGAPVPMGA